MLVTHIISLLSTLLDYWRVELAEDKDLILGW